MICDYLVIGLENNDLRKCILRKIDLKLKDAVEMFLHHESPKKYVEYMSFPEKEETTYKVKTRQNKERGQVCRYCRRFQTRCDNNYCPSDGKTSSACQKKIHQRRNKTSVKQLED